MLRCSEVNEHDRSGAGKERYAALCAVCESSKRNGTRPFGSPPYCTALS